MNKSKCKGCQWNNKPYWSIINPCENCYRDEVQTITNWVDPTINQLQQENKDLKEEIKKMQRIVISKQEDYLIISVGEITKVFKLNDNKKWINEVGDSNE